MVPRLMEARIGLCLLPSGRTYYQFRRPKGRLRGMYVQALCGQNNVRAKLGVNLVARYSCAISNTASSHSWRRRRGEYVIGRILKCVLNCYCRLTLKACPCNSHGIRRAGRSTDAQDPGIALAQTYPKYKLGFSATPCRQYLPALLGHDH